MNFNEYQKLAYRTSKDSSQEGSILNGVMGMNGEAGECIDIVKKTMFQEHKLNKEKLIKEAGDVLWYVAELCTGLNISMEDVAKLNIEKLKKRYPNGFEAERSINREGE